MPRDLKIMQHNICAYSPRDKLLADYWNTENPDVVCLNSTSLGDKQYISAKNYAIYYSPQETHSGSAILVNKKLSHVPVFTGNKHLLAVRIHTESGPVVVATYYRVFDRNKSHHIIPYNEFNKLHNRNHPFFFLEISTFVIGVLGIQKM